MLGTYWIVFRGLCIHEGRISSALSAMDRCDAIEAGRVWWWESKKHMPLQELVISIGRPPGCGPCVLQLWALARALLPIASFLPGSKPPSRNTQQTTVYHNGGSITEI